MDNYISMIHFFKVVVLNTWQKRTDPAEELLLHRCCRSRRHHKHIRSMTNEGGHNQRKRSPSATDPRRVFCGCIFIFLLLAGVTALIVWLVYRPQKPRFIVVGVAIFNLNDTSPPFLSTTMQFSIVARNPNKRVSIFYDHLSAFVTYHNQMITQPATLPSMYHDKHSTIKLAPILGGGAAVTVSPEVSYGLGMDQSFGVVGLRMLLLGKLRWKAGAIITSRYGIYVKCDVMLRLSKGLVGQVPLVSSPVSCKVDI